MCELAPRCSTARSILALIAVFLLAAPAARADLYAAKAAYQKQDYVKAFELFHELAELGLTLAQSTVAAMYVQGEGVKRDNRMGYAWARVAQANGDHLVTGAIVEQLEPHVDEAMRQLTRDLMSKYGPDALQRALLPDPDTPVPKNADRDCALKSRAKTYYPTAVIGSGVIGFVLAEVAVMPDGRAHDPQIWFAQPDHSFDEAARQYLRRSVFTFNSKDRTRSCRMLTAAQFFIPPREEVGARRELDRMRQQANDGDPRAQMMYGFMLFARPELNVDKEQPVNWYVKAAEAGLPAAQFLTGLELERRSAPSEKAKGEFWMNKAAERGSPDAKLALAHQILHEPSNAAGIRHAQELLETAVSDGDHGQSYGSDAEFYLAALLAAGPEGATLDPTRALSMIDHVQAEIPGSPTVEEIRAAGSAALGKFDDACKAQRKALGMAKTLGWDTAPQQARLDAYTHQQAWRGNFFAP
jgi:TPR repeat protein